MPPSCRISAAWIVVTALLANRVESSGKARTSSPWMAGYLRTGAMKSKEDVVQGIENFPEALLKLFNGENFGKLVLQVAQD